MGVGRMDKADQTRSTLVELYGLTAGRGKEGVVTEAVDPLEQEPECMEGGLSGGGYGEED